MHCALCIMNSALCIMNYALESVAYVGGEVDDGAEERIGGAAILMTVEAENTTEEEIAEIVG